MSAMAVPRWERARQEWLCERAEAETQPCTDCGQPAGQTCVGLFDQPLTRFPAHPGRIAAAAAAARSRATHPEEDPTP